MLGTNERSFAATVAGDREHGLPSDHARSCNDSGLGTKGVEGLGCSWGGGQCSGPCGDTVGRDLVKPQSSTEATSKGPMASSWILSLCLGLFPISQPLTQSDDSWRSSHHHPSSLSFPQYTGQLQLGRNWVTGVGP